MVSRFRGYLPAWGWLLLGTVILGLAHLPVVLVPLNGDDFVNYLTMDAQYHGSLWHAVTQSWIGNPQHNRFNPVSNEFARMYHVLIFRLSGALGLDAHYLYRAGVGALAWVTAAAGAYAWRGAARFIDPDRTVSFSRTFCALAIALAVTLQLHVGISSDPDTFASEIAYPTTALSLLLFGLVLSAMADSTVSVRRIVVIGVVALVTVLFYEPGIAAVGAIVAVLALAYLRGHWSHGRGRLLALIAVIAVIPGLVSLAGRLWINAHSPGQYTGTEPVSGLKSLQTFGRLLVSSMPGVAWPEAGRPIEDIRLGLPMVACVVLLVGTSAIALVMLATTQREPLHVGPRMWIVGAGGVLWLVGVLAMYASSQRYVEKIHEVGHVYLNYTTGVMFVALAAVAIFGNVRWRRSKGLLVTLTVLALGFMAYQNVINWRLGSWGAHKFDEHRALISAVSNPHLSSAQRCARLSRWSKPEPGEQLSAYSAAVAFGANYAYTERYGKPFCKVGNEK